MTATSDPQQTTKSEKDWKTENMVWTRVYYGYEVMQRILETIEKKHALLGRHWIRYLLRAAMAGVILTLFYLFAYQVSTDLGPSSNPGLSKYLMAVSFSMALAFIFFTNSELLTSNFMYFTVGLYYGKIRLRDTLAVLGLCLAGNLLGVVVVCLLVRSCNMVGGDVLANLLHTVEYKTVTSGAWLIFVKAIFANFFINVSLIISMQLQESLAKMAALMMGVTVFAYMGYEHVVANSALFAVAYLFEPSAVDSLHVAKNFVWSLIGNYVGGGLVIGLFYAYLNDNRQSTPAVST